MRQSMGMLACLGAAVVGVMPLPAQADEATVQTSTQEAVISGDNNQVTQVVNQVNIQHPGLGNGIYRRAVPNQNNAVVQDSYQGAAIDGDNNQVYQESTQLNVQQRSRGRGHQRGRNK